jgi:putative transposase
MLKNHSLAAAIMDVTWGKLRLFTAYKEERCGGRMLRISPNGTSQICSGCGLRKTKIIGLETDVNAALNILKRGLEEARAEKLPLLVRQRISMFAPRKQEARGSIPE